MMQETDSNVVKKDVTVLQVGVLPFEPKVRIQAHVHNFTSILQCRIVSYRSVSIGRYKLFFFLLFYMALKLDRLLQRRKVDRTHLKQNCEDIWR